MFWKLAFVAALAVGVLGEITDEQREAVKKAINEQCTKVNATDKATDVQNSIKTFGECLKGLFDVDTIKREIEEAKPHGNLDEVFKKYCAKAPQLKACLHSVIAGVSPCLPTEARALTPTADNATDSLIDFACFREGDRLALFVAEKGPECFTTKADAIRACGETAKQSVTSLAVQLSKTEKCHKFDETASCVVKALEGCDTPTPANMVESVIKYVRKLSPCKDIEQKKN